MDDRNGDLQARQKLSELTHSFDTAMLVTHGSGGELHARPMAIAQVLGDAEVWFATSLATPKVDELLSDERVLVIMQSEQRYLSVNGVAELHRDAERVRELWKESWRAWFKDPGDPELVLIRVRPTGGEYWDNSGLAGARFLFEAARAYVSGERIGGSDDVRQHAKVSL